MKCAQCATRACSTRQMEKAPDFCPMKWEKSPGATGKQMIMGRPDLSVLALSAARVESEGYCRWTRLEETMEFAKKCGFSKIGIAFCSGLREEARTLDSVLRSNGFRVFSAICCCGGVLKEDIGLKDEEKVRPGTNEVMCNPIGQAHVLSETGTELNIVVGLCVGHDSLFLMHSKAPATVLVAKDRVLAHNPAGAIYTANGYYRTKLHSHPFDRPKQ